MSTKTCTACGDTFPATNEFFARHPECRGGLDTACKKCRLAQRKQWRRNNRDRLAKRRRERYAAEYKERHEELERLRAARFPFRISAENLMDGARERAKKLGLVIAPELRSKAFIIEWLRAVPNCPCCGRAFHFGRKGNGRKSDASPSFDRFSILEGYTLLNTELICWRCNNLKRDATAVELRGIADWMDRRTPTFAEAA